ncbi:diacylglycerol/lipid kinase family protein [Desulfosporosinus meridiei]|uniref:Sphingosine/diacylglycerol kinase-like enzyme n=1 Tax=Desulfosporosinus meridiei (strain ATCC BAA-275 / DSM 13257 / KCTC 12902 / NCIMB 13706 / S10) TaxID=768704 RepID=J7IZB3_DESMD|nr:diacylglycerol kinase family protein [Desulfosporosinus meridiei]AFQ44051.1 sphingosine/diacylglycerol kinase-like enzyme [Desulfosporosinus meridiei DSM 13257]
MRCLLILNPGSQGGKSKAKFERIFAFLHKNRVKFDYRLTKTLDDAYTFSLAGNKKGYDVILAVGGDGTINRVISGFYDLQGKRISNSKLAVIHTGTSPDFCKSYNLPLEIDQALNAVLEGKTVQIPMAKITYLSEYDEKLDGKPLSLAHEKLQTSYFACCANIGIGASVARGANNGIRDYLGDFAGTLVSLIKALISYHPVNFSVRIDGKQEVLEKAYNIFVGKTTYIASGLKVKNELALNDPRLYGLIIQKLGLVNWVNVLKKLYSGDEFANNAAMSLLYVHKMEIFGNPANNEIEFDGDPRGFLPCKIEPAGEALDVICPQDGLLR